MNFISMVLFALACVCGIYAPPVKAWDTHALITGPALKVLPSVNNAPPVAAESFLDFALATQDALAPLLDAEEVWARANLTNYAPRPEALRLSPPVSQELVREALMHALRISPKMPLKLYRALLPDGLQSNPNPVGLADVFVIVKSAERQHPRLQGLSPGDLIAPMDVLLSAVDEPDFGLDIGLWSDNGTAYGQSYGYGKMPFGNLELEFASQAPFHMGFFHESPIVYKAAPFLMRTFPEMRIHQFMTLARFALKNGHPYWGYRFLGWGLHYIQDLAQPYHATVLPGAPLWRMLAINAVALIGWEGPKVRAVQLVSNRHLALENFQWSSMRKAYEHGNMEHPLLLAPTKRHADERFGQYDDTYVRTKVTFNAHEMANRTDEALTKNMPSHLVSDPNYIFLVTDPEINMANMIDDQGSPEGLALTQIVGDLLEAVGAHTRAYVSYVQAP